jgi:hypothetical protein
VDIYGVLSLSVAARRREIAIRAARVDPLEALRCE